MHIHSLIEDFHRAINEPMEPEIIEKAERFYEYMRKIGISEHHLSSWNNHRRRIVNTMQIIGDAIGERQVDTIVDIGANMIFLPMWRQLRPNARIVLGIDEGQAKYLREKGESIESYHGDFEFDAIPLEDNSIDVVGMFEVFEHFYVDPMFVVSQVNRILRPGGLFFVTAPNSTSWRSCLAALTHYHPYQYSTFAGPGSRRHVHEPAPQDLYIALTSGGFDTNVFTLNNFTREVPQSFIEFFDSIGTGSGNRGDTVVAIGKKIGPVTERYPGGLYDRSSMAISGNLNRP